MHGPLIFFSILALASSLALAADDVFLREDFNDLDDWRPWTFQGVDRHTRYAIVTDGTGSRLRAESRGSASGLVLEKEFDVYAYPRLRWRWKVDNVYRGGDARTRSGDDYPMRICVVFRSGPGGEGAWGSLRHGIAGLLLGEDPPHSSLEYVWANREEAEDVLTSPYTDRVRLFLVEKGPLKLGRWLEHEVDIVRDYRRAFGRDPPARAVIALMNDADNTGEASTSAIDWIEVLK